MLFGALQLIRFAAYARCLVPFGFTTFGTLNPAFLTLQETLSSMTKQLFLLCLKMLGVFRNMALPKI